MRLPIIIAAVLALGLSACAQRSTAPGPAAPALPGPLTARQSSYPDKVAPVAGDKVLITDSEALNAPKQVSLGAIADLAGLPTWLPAAAPTADNMIIQATGGCSNITYTDQATCDANSGTWTPPVGAWTSIIDGLINDAGTGTDDLLSASEIDSRISSAGAFYQVADVDLADLADGSLSGGKVGTGINAANLTTGTLPDARLSTAVAKYVTAPTTATDTCTAGQMAYASGFLYVCIATNTWQRATMAAW